MKPTKQTYEENLKVNIALLQQDIDFIKVRVDDISKMMTEQNKQFVNQEEFKLVRNIVYGLISILVLSALTTILINNGLKIR